MCEPATIAAATAWLAANAGTALTIASTAAGIGGSVMSFQQQKAAAEANEKSARSAYEVGVSQITERQMQEQSSAAQRSFENQREYDAARSAAIVAGEGAGVRGLSVDALLSDLAGQQAARQKAVEQNLDWTTRALQQDKVSAASARDSRINSVQRPSGAALAIDIAGQAAKGFDTYKTRSDPTWGKPRSLTNRGIPKNAPTGVHY